jgi:hypothetical protein
MIKQDTHGLTVRVDPCTSLIRVDGIIVCKLVIREHTVFLEFKDGDRMRSQCRKTQFVEIPLEAFSAVLMAELLKECKPD